MFEHDAFEGMSSLRRPVGGLEMRSIGYAESSISTSQSMPSKAIVFLLLLVLLSACQGKRKALETLNLSQRHGQQIQYHDTLWQTLSLHLDGLTMEWQTDSVGGTGTLVRAQAEHAELGTQRQTHTVVYAEVQHRDTMATHQETVESVPPSSATRSAWCAWLLLILLVVAIAAYVWFRLWRPRWWG